MSLYVQTLFAVGRMYFDIQVYSRMPNKFLVSTDVTILGALITDLDVEFDFSDITASVLNVANALIDVAKERCEY